MKEEQLTEEYLSRFPTILNEALHDEKHRTRFLRTVSDDYDDVVPVYRAIHREDIVCEDDFLCNVEEAEKYEKPPYKRLSIEHYGISVNEDKNQIMAAMKIPNPRTKWMGIAVGSMKKEYGPADFKDNKTHHNWYLYEDKINEVMNLFKADCVEALEQCREGHK